ncbi:MAG: malonic semialdehyde reductase [Bdellovibrio sp.]|nr:malonic semialdehyde reductase [Bdellovibrio sp.]
MRQSLSKESLQQLFTEARTHHTWTNKPVSDDTLHAIYDLTKWGPTSVNALPMRIVFVKSKQHKDKLTACVSGSNVGQINEAPVTAIISMDTKFYNYLPTLFPAFDAKAMFTSNAAASESTAFRNSSLQGAYFMLAVRSLGLDVGPMSGFDNAKADEAFFKGTSWKSNFLCNSGYGDDTKVFPRGPRLSFEQTCKIV